MDTRLAVALSSPATKNLSKPQLGFLSALQDRIERAGLRVIPDSASSDDVEHRLAKVRTCHGIVVLTCSQWKAERLYRGQDKAIVLPSEFSHIAAVMAVAAQRPLLVLREKNVAERGAFRRGYVRRLVDVPSSLKTEWLDSPEFDSEFNNWLKDVGDFRHVFLGYSSQATAVANIIRTFLTEKMKLRIFDWHDFRTGDTIWDSIERAERLTSCGVFLFMADDKFGDRANGEFAPRDNVVYEAGYFAGAKGRPRSLIIREEGAKIPTDLGGILYLPLASRSDISPIESRLREHLERMLGD